MEEELMKTDLPEQELPAEELPQEEEKPVFNPRPPYQVWAARIGLLIMIICVILYYLQIATGGKL